MQHTRQEAAPRSRYVIAHTWRMWVGGGTVVREAMGGGPSFGWAPPTNVHEVEDGIVVHVELAGLQRGDLHIAAEGHTLVIAGHRREPPVAQRIRCHQMEIPSGPFRSEVQLLWPVKPDEIEADYREGFLTVFVPRPGGRP
jgi:HSP20 family protein